MKTSPTRLLHNLPGFLQRAQINSIIRGGEGLKKIALPVPFDGTETPGVQAGSSLGKHELDSLLDVSTC